MVVELGGFEPESERVTMRLGGVSVRIRCESDAHEKDPHHPKAVGENVRPT